MVSVQQYLRVFTSPEGRLSSDLWKDCLEGIQEKSGTLVGMLSGERDRPPNHGANKQELRSLEVPNIASCLRFYISTPVQPCSCKASKAIDISILKTGRKEKVV